VIAFAREGESVLLDAIPLFEVMSIEMMLPATGSDQRGDQHGQPTNSYDNVIDFTHALQIRTVKNGQNAGRKYILRASSDGEVTSIVQQLTDLAKKAARKEAANSWRERLQLKIRVLYCSQWFQALTAILFIAVRDISLFLIILIS
jgi:hypothetical protein